MPRPSSGVPAFGGKWDSLSPPLSPWILDVIRDQGFTRMTPVQAGTIPRAVKNQDCVVEAVTGSGKTLAFVVPVLERLVRNEHKFKKGEVAAIVIAPTRELASQIHDVFHMFLSSLIPPPPVDDGNGDGTSPQPPPAPAPYPLPTLITSGTPTPYETFLSLASSILIGTPGRLASFLLSPRGISVVRVGELDVLVLDEADRLLSAPDHRRDVERIMRHLPKQRRTHLFSATMTDAVEDLVGLGLRNPVRIVVNLKDKREGQDSQERRVPMGLQNKFLVCAHAEKTLQLVRSLDRESKINESAKFIVYFSTCAAVDYFYRILSRLPALERFHFTSLHGDLPPRVRETALAAFTSHPSSHLSPGVLLCTDVAARGVDFADMDVVIQYDPPTDPKTFSHRAGRTARAGRAGTAILLVGRGREEQYVAFLAARKIPLVPTPYLSATLDPADPTDQATAIATGTATQLPEVDPDALALLDQIRAIVLTDRDLADRGAKALVSSVRAYTKHEASFIFRLTDLDFAALGTAYGLLRLPVMPEVRDWRKRRDAAAKRKRAAAEAGPKAVEPVPSSATSTSTSGPSVAPVPEAPETPWTDAEVEWDAYAYASKSREAARLSTLAEKREKAKANGEGKDDVEHKKRKIRAELREAWSDQRDKKVRKEDRRDRKDQRKRIEWERAQAELGEGGDGGEGGTAEGGVGKSAAGLPPPPVAGTNDEHNESADEVDDDYRALKREVQEERAARKAHRSERSGPAASGAVFDGLD